MKLDDLQKMGFDKDEYVELITLFVETGLSDVSEIEKALKSENLEGAAAAAHSLKGAADSFGERELFEIAKDIQERIRSGSSEGVLESLSVMKSHLESVNDRIEG